MNHRKILIGLAGIGAASAIAAGAALGTGEPAKAQTGYAEKPLLGETVTPLEEVPAWVIHTAKVTLPGASWTAAQLDEDEIEAVWEIQGTFEDAATEVDVYADGSLEEVEQVIDAKQVPSAAAELFETNFPEFETVKIEKSTRTTRTGLLELWYEWDGTTADGKAVDVEVDSRGTVYLVEPD